VTAQGDTVPRATFHTGFTVDQKNKNKFLTLNGRSSFISVISSFSFCFFCQSSRVQKGSSEGREVLCPIESVVLSWVNFKDTTSLREHEKDPLFKQTNKQNPAILYKSSF
jgi:hypothetical protein